MSKPDITSRVMEEISSQSVTMRPRWHYTAVTIVSIFSVIMLSLVTVYLVNIATLAVRIQINNRPMYGARQRLSDLLINFPWWMIILAVICIGILVWLLRRSGTIYRYSIGWIIAAVVVLSLVFGITFSYLPLSDSLHKSQGGFGRNGQGQNR